MKMPKTLILAILSLFTANTRASDDPMRPYSGTATNSTENSVSPLGTHASKSSPLPTLNSTMIGEHYQAAIINGQLVTVGQTVGNLTVSQISHNQVQLKDQQETITLQVTTDIKQSPSSATMESQQ